ncbi:hypothetical protein [Secundilactobacillus silagei]|uniref:Surface layer protein A domain-containing protein n=1 Tax=Secundilactobacillus silagei JCM 19001 TaxID=1302250 RepID=A0A1Z5IJ03_9LACO|nr:hypothetical protein [Secundilactobacillus silagei]TDG71073.1 hypothetical protein C5L25_001261 [Secundilactobacillus silagei JCM 19001]GAX01743.1 hypothetical protein IWT126_01786 [Secundilactobacillus silagei JCM 19001]
MKKSILVTLAFGIALVGGAVTSGTTAQAATLHNTKVHTMPAYFRHTWHHGKDMLKFTKHHVRYRFTGKSNGKMYKDSGRIHYSHVEKFTYKHRVEYAPIMNADPLYLYSSHGHMYMLDTTGHWYRYHR